MQRNTQRRGRRAAQPTALTRLSTKLNQLHRQVHGAKLVPQIDPPAFVQRPWNSYTFERTSNTTAAYQDDILNADDIMNQLRNRMGLESGAGVRIKVERVQVWATSTGPTFSLPDIEVDFYELLSNPAAKPAVRSVQRDIGTLQAPAKVGYEYPVADAKEVITEDEAKTRLICRVVAAEIGTKNTIRAHVLWKSITV